VPDLVASGVVQRASAAFVLVSVLSFGGTSGASIWPTAEKRIEQKLADPDVLVRRGAARSLPELPTSAGRRLALAALGDADPDVRIAALRAAVELGSAELGAHLVSWLTDPDTRIRLAAAEALTRRPSAAALPALGRASSDTDPKVRAAVARALGASESPDAVVPLLGRLDDPVPEVRREVVNALGHLGDRRAVVPLLAKVEDSAGLVRRAVAHALGLLGDPRAVSALVLVLRDSDETVRVAALDAVGRLGDASAVSSVAAVLASDEPSVRAAAATALGRLATPAAVTALIGELARPDADPDPVVRALGTAGAAARKSLRACVDAPGAPAVVEGCARSLTDSGDETDVPRLRSALERGAASPLAVLPVLGHVGGQAAVPVVLEELDSSDGEVRRAALDALALLLDPQHPDGRAVDPLLSALRARHTTAAERPLILRLLGRSGAVRVGSELARIASEATVKQVVVAAVNALGDLGPGAWEPMLLAKLDDEDGDVRTAAALTLRRAASERTLSALLERLERAPEQDREALGLALPGAAARSRDAHTVDRLLALLAQSEEGERDPVIEAVAQAQGSAGALRALAREPDAADRAKVAEVAAGEPALLPLLLELVRDATAAVRANAAWSLGFVAAPRVFPELQRLLGDQSPEVAANAAVALGRSAALAQHDARPELCPRLHDPRSIVRASVLTGLRLAAESCDEAAIIGALANDPSPRVRAAAADLLASTPATKTSTEARVRCAAEDENRDVAAHCGEPIPKPPSTTNSVLVFVVPTGADTPAPRGSFALRFADGSERFGVTDRRGAVSERLAPAGPLELGPLPVAGD
jgi:HEAT repeat protein